MTLPRPNLVSPRVHRAIDLLTFPGLLIAASALARVDRRAAAVVAATALVEGAATAATDYPPPVVSGRISFRAHNRWAASHGVLVLLLAATLPGLTRFGRRALATLGVMPITLSWLSDTRPRRSPTIRPPATPGRRRETLTSAHR